MYSPNGTSCRFTYSGPGPRPRGPQLPGVAQRVPEHLADQHRPVDGLHRRRDRAEHRGILPGIQVGGVLRPDHQVRCGPAARRTCAASCSVAAAWFAVTVVARSRSGRFLACGTSPWMAATVAAGVPAGTGSTGSRPPARASPAAPAKASAGTSAAAQPARRPRRQQQPGEGAAGEREQEGEQRRTADGGPAARSAPRLAHGQPAPRERRTATGRAAPRQRPTSPPRPPARPAATAAPAGPRRARAKMTASATASAAQAYQARLISQDSSGTNSASPNSSPTAKLARRLRPCSATTSSAGPSRGQRPRPDRGKGGGEDQSAGHGGQQRPAQREARLAGQPPAAPPRRQRAGPPRQVRRQQRVRHCGRERRRGCSGRGRLARPAPAAAAVGMPVGHPPGWSA